MRSLLIIIALGAVVVPGMAYGLWTGRWTLSDEPEASAARLSQLPLYFGKWDGEDLAMDSRPIAQADLAGFLSRRYLHRIDRTQITVFLACGRPGPTSVHTPNVCYPGQGYNMVQDAERKTIDCLNSSAEFFTAIFEKQNPAGEKYRIQIYWSWKAGGDWQAASYPRLVFGGQPVLHKLYVIRHLTDSNPASEKNCVEFIQSLVPEMQKSLFDQ